jgi:hypothetical protein
MIIVLPPGPLAPAGAAVWAKIVVASVMRDIFVIAC